MEGSMVRNNGMGSRNVTEVRPTDGRKNRRKADRWKEYGPGSCYQFLVSPPLTASTREREGKLKGGSEGVTKVGRLGIGREQKMEEIAERRKGAQERES
jgi:hypothetical protein